MDMNLATQVPVEIDGALAVTAEEFSVRSQRPLRIRKGAIGALGKAKGVFTYTGALKFVLPKLGAEFDWDALKASETGFTISYEIGAARFLVSGVEIDTDSVTTNAENGEVTYEFTWMATERIQTA